MARLQLCTQAITEALNYRRRHSIGLLGAEEMHGRGYDSTPGIGSVLLAGRDLATSGSSRYSSSDTGSSTFAIFSLGIITAPRRLIKPQYGAFLECGRLLSRWFPGAYQLALSRLLAVARTSAVWPAAAGSISCSTIEHFPQGLITRLKVLKRS